MGTIIGEGEQQHIAIYLFKEKYPNTQISNVRIGSGRVIVEGSNGEKVEL